MNRVLPVIVATLVLSSCAQSSRSYVYDSEGFMVTRGEILSIHGILSRNPQRLLDGVVHRVEQSGGRAVIRIGERVETLYLDPGSEIVLARGGEFVLVPREGGWPTAPIGEEMLEIVNLAVDLIALGSPGEAKSIIDQLVTLFPENASVRQFQAFLRSRLPRREKEGLDAAVVEVTHPEEAKQVYRNAQSLLKINRNDDALQAFERAHKLDPVNLEITDSLVFLLKHMGLELYSKGRLDEAVVYWEKILVIRPADIEGMRFLRRAKAVELRM
ncbi:MAG: tetratricopeptide repeat protein [Planctomycetota bacterium]|nr:tetratricopeptide repeat protein [Planctomycetota bacterium]